MKATKKSSVPLTPSLQAAMDLKEFCRLLIRSNVKTRAQKDGLARELMMTPGGVESLLYHGSGSFENYMASISYLYGLEGRQLQEGFQLLTKTPKREDALTESDRAWFALSDHYDENFRIFLLDLLAQTSAKYRLSVKRIGSKD